MLYATCDIFITTILILNKLHIHVVVYMVNCTVVLYILPFPLWFQICVVGIM